jgi:hypothetical protein
MLHCHLNTLPHLCSEAGATAAGHGQGSWLQPLVTEPPWPAIDLPSPLLGACGPG